MLAIEESESERLLKMMADVTARTSFKGHAEESRRRWYPLCIQTQLVHVISGHMIGYGLKFFSPAMPVDVPVHSRNVITGARYISGRKRVLKPMFPGYAFARIDYAVEFQKVRSRPGVLRCLENVDGPVVVSDLLITALREKEADLVEQKQKQPLPYKEGQEVRVLQGPFADFIGKIERLDDNERIRLLLDLFGRKTPINLEAHEIEAI